MPVWGEVELAVRSLTHPAPVVAIGGTNGKSTTTSLVGAMLEAHGLRDVRRRQPRRAARRPRGRALRRRRPRGLELPDGARRPLPPARARAAQRHRRPPRPLRELRRRTRTPRATPSRGRPRTTGPSSPRATRSALREARRGQGARRHVRAGRRRRRDRRRGRRPRAPASASRARDMALAGGHNALNVAAAIACVRAVRRRAADAIRARASRAFAGLPHRTALVAEIGGVRFYDDSKGTNVGAAVTALEGLAEPRAVLIAGGRDKGGSYAPLVDALAREGPRRRPHRRGRRRHRRAPSATRVPVRRAAHAWTTRCASARALAAPGRRRAPLARVLELRHVPRLQAPRRRVRPRRARAASEAAMTRAMSLENVRRTRRRCSSPRPLDAKPDAAARRRPGRPRARRDGRRARRLRRRDGLQRERRRRRRCSTTTRSSS